MNKKIKMIELLQKIANKEELPQKILIKDIVWYLVKDSEGTFTYSQTQDNDWQNYIDYKIALTRNLNEDVLILDDEIEILEDNTEEQEKLGESWKEVGKRVGEWAKEFEQGFKESFAEIINYPFKNLEDNTEEIEELKGWGLATDYKDIETINHTLDRFGNKINELVKAVNEIRKDKSND